MNISRLQNDIIKKILSIEDKEFLEFFKEVLANNSDSEIYNLSDFEKSILSESTEEYKKDNVIDNQEVFQKNNKWLEE